MSDGQKILDVLGQKMQEERTYYEGAIKDGMDKISGEQKERLEKIGGDIEVLEKRYNDLVVKMNRPTIDSGISGGHLDDNSRKHIKEFDNYLRGYQTKAEYMVKMGTRALDGTSDASGGFLVPSDYETKIISKAYELAVIRQFSNVATTGRDRAQVPSVSNINFGWGAPGSTAPDNTNSSGLINIDIQRIFGSIKIARDTLNDAAADILGYITNVIPQAIAEKEDEGFSVGMGGVEPLGIFTDANVQARYVPSGVAAAITDATNNGVDALIEMAETGIKTYYRQNACWLFNSSTSAAIRQLKDTTDAYYLYSIPMVSGDFPTLLGSKVLISEFAPDIAANAYPIVYGDLMAGYYIRDNGGLVIERNDSIYADTDMAAFFIKKRTGAQVVLPEAFVCMKVATS